MKRSVENKSAYVKYVKVPCREAPAIFHVTVLKKKQKTRKKPIDLKAEETVAEDRNTEGNIVLEIRLKE